MVSANFSFDLFRLNVIDFDDIFSFGRRARANDDDICRIFKTAAGGHNDVRRDSHRAQYMWSVRNYSEYTAQVEGRRMFSVLLARSRLSAEGSVVTPDSIITQVSESSPPLAEVISVIVDLDRHLVAVEHSGWSSNSGWRAALHEILDAVARGLELASSIELEPIPTANRIINLFKSFDAVTRLKVTLRIPNPELTRYTKDLYEDLKQSRVREYAQDMKNPEGISKNENARPYASAALADQGYKKGEVTIEGQRGGSFEKIRAGSKATRGSITQLREFVRGMGANARTQETKKVLQALTAEIDRIHPKDGIESIQEGT